MSSRSCALVIVVVILLACVACEIGLTGVSGEKADPSGADPSLADRLGTSSSKQRVGEPATIDAASLYFENMDEHELATQYSMPPPVDTAIGAQVHALASRFVTTSFVDVVLVGFGGDGEAAVSLEAGELQRYLSHAGLGREQVKHVLRGSTHDLPMGTRYLYRIVHAHSSLRARIQMAVQTTVDHLVANNPFVLEAVEANRHASKPGTHKPPRLPVLRVPARVVHQLITEEYEAARMHQTAVYLLNLQPIVLRDETKPHRPAEVREGTQERVRLHYVYTQEAPERGENESGAPDESAVPPPHHCPTLHWESSLHRLSWFDLSAGPLAYGPSTEGEGVITDYSTPSIGRMLRDQTRHAQQVWESKTRGGSVNSEVPFRPSVELDSHYRHTLLSDLALLVHKTTRALLAPPTHRWPITHAEHVRVHLIFVHERRRHVEASNDPHAAHEDTATTDAASDERTQSRAWSAVEHELLGLALPGQTIEVRRHDLRFEECAQCVAAYAHSLRTSAASVQTDHSTPTSMHIHTHVRHHLDATELKDWLEHFDSSQWGLKDDSASSAGVRVMRVFIYDLAATQPVLLDRSHQSVAFDDMVVAVQSRAAPPRDVDFECAGRDLTMDPRDASRATLAAILTAGWGIVPAYQTWSPHRNDTERDFMFATGNTPFGHFSRETKLNFAIKDAVLRHQLLSTLHSSLSPLVSLLSPSRSLAPSSSRGPPSSLVDTLLYGSPSVDFVRRWNVLSRRVSSVHHWLNLNQLRQATPFVDAVRRDAEALHRLAKAEIDTLTVSLACDASPTSAADGSSLFAFLASSHHLLFLGLEAAMLVAIVVACWIATSQLDRLEAAVVRILPTAIAEKIGLKTKRKYF